MMTVTVDMEQMANSQGLPSEQEQQVEQPSSTTSSVAFR
jgi:hypothetical protein